MRFSCCLLATSCLPAVLSGALVSEDFNSIPNGPLAADTNWAAFSGADDSVTVTDGVAAFGSGAEDLGIEIGSNVSNVYFGLDISVSDGASSDYVMGLRDGSSLAARFFLDDTPEGIRLGVNSGTGSSAGAFTSFSFDLDTVVRLVGYADGTGTVSAWINPSSLDVGTPDVTFTNSDAGGFDDFYFRQGGSWDNGAADWTADNLVVSTSFAEVVPEPSIALLGSISFLILLRRRR